MRRSFCTFLALVSIAAILGLRCGETPVTEPDVPDYGVSPDSAAVEVSSSQQFTATFESQPTETIWYVNGVRGGSPETGMITSDGLFIAPPEVPAGGSVTITAEAQLESAVRETAKAVIRSGYGTPFVEVSPGSTTVAVADSITFSPAASGCPLADPSWSVVAISSSSGPAGDIRADGTYVAPHQISEDLTVMVTVESPDCPGKTGISKVLIKRPVTFRAEIEDFTSSSGSGISQAVPCSGGYAVDGLDEPGEWIEIPLETPAAGTYTAEIHYAAGKYDVLEVTVVASGCADSPAPQEATFQMADGNGFG